jgi:drug/metabolite transporter (DMT)-like permease
MLAKERSAPREIFVGIVQATASICLVLLPVVGLPSKESWPWIGAASACNVLYLRVLIAAYANSEFSVVYAVIRATIPPTLFLMGWLFLTEPGRTSAVAGLIFVATSLIFFATRNGNFHKLNLRALALSIAAGLMLALSLLFDVKGIRTGSLDIEHLLRYGAASSLTTASGLGIVSAFTHRNLFAVLRNNTKLCYLGAVLLLISYVCGMWAYAQGPIGLVAPLRESGILFSGILAVLVLRERVSEVQWAAMALATIGVLLIQIG